MITFDKDIIINISRFINSEKDLHNVIYYFPNNESEIWKMKSIDKFLNYNREILKKNTNIFFNFNKNNDYKSVFYSLIELPNMFYFPYIYNYGIIEINNNKIYFNGNFSDGNRCVRSNTPYELTNKIYSNFYYTNKFNLFSTLVYYYEITILSCEEKYDNPCISIGFCQEEFPLVGRQLGWDINSYGLHSDNGKVYFNNVSDNYTKPFGENDCIGCGIFFNGTEHNIFYTKNGKFLGFAFREIKQCKLYPAVGIDCKNKIKFNFGAQKFEFNFMKINDLACQSYKLFNNKKKIFLNRKIPSIPILLSNKYTTLNIILKKYKNEIQNLEIIDYEKIIMNILRSISLNNINNFNLLTNNIPSLSFFLSGPFITQSLLDDQEESITADSDDEMNQYLEINFP